jgi:AcrR family transcriptional regulator
MIVLIISRDDKTYAAVFAGVGRGSMSAQTRRQNWDLTTSVEERREQILRTLGEYLREHHLSSLKMQDIANRLGMTKGNLYYYFKSKQDILFHCHMRSVEHSLAVLEEALMMPAPQSERLCTLLVRHIRNITDEAFSAVLLTDLDNLTNVQRRRYITLRDKFEQGVVSIIKAGIESGEFVQQDATLAGFAMLGGCNWISKWYDAKGASTAQEIAESFAKFFLRGLTAGVSPSL